MAFLNDNQKLSLKQAVADARNPAIKGKCISLGGEMWGAVTDEQREPFVVGDDGVKRTKES
jgi:hypothetical protein